MSIIPFSAMSRIKTVVALLLVLAGGFAFGYAFCGWQQIPPAHAQLAIDPMPNWAASMGTSGQWVITGTSSSCVIKKGAAYFESPDAGDIFVGFVSGNATPVCADPREPVAATLLASTAQEYPTTMDGLPLRTGPPISTAECLRIYPPDQVGGFCDWYGFASLEAEDAFELTRGFQRVKHEDWTGDTWEKISAMTNTAALFQTPPNYPVNFPAHYRLASDNATLLPDPVFSPGVVRNLSTTQICTIKWGADRRHVTAKMKREVCSAYGIAPGDCTGKNYEIDHLVPRELGGADDVKNLWPQPRIVSGLSKIDQARLKDRLENALHRELCAAPLPDLRLAISQKLMEMNWYAAYLSRFGATK